jgi:hypothetical protein
MHTLELTDDELRLVSSAVHAYLDDFGHEEADVLREIKAVLAKFPSGIDEGATAKGGLTSERLASLLREAERAHGAYEKELGRRDEDWPAWYAAYIVGRLAGD